MSAAVRLPLDSRLHSLPMRVMLGFSGRLQTYRELGLAGDDRVAVAKFLLPDCAAIDVGRVLGVDAANATRPGDGLPAKNAWAT